MDYLLCSFYWRVLPIINFVDYFFFFLEALFVVSISCERTYLTYKHLHTHVWPAVCFSGGACVFVWYVCLSIVVCVCAKLECESYWCLHFILFLNTCQKWLLDLVFCWSFQSYLLLLKNVLFFAPNSFMDSFVYGPLHHVILPAAHGA